MDYRRLADELTKDPAGLGYAALGSDVEALAVMLNDPTRSRPRGPVTAADIFDALDPGDFAAMTGDEMARVSIVMQAAPMDLASDHTIGMLKGSLGSNAGAALDALRTVTASRAEELGLGEVTPAEVKMALGGKW